MTDFENLLLREQRNPNATILQFFLSRYDAEQIVVILEGDDDRPFYFDFIASYFPGKSIFYFACSGKASLLALKSFLASYDLGFEPEKFLFLTDKDFDDYLGKNDNDVFQTDFYSIENYFCNAAYFEYVLRKFGGTTLSNRKIEELVNAFNDQLHKTVKKLVVPMAVLCALRSRDSNADFDSISCTDFIVLNSANLLLTRRRWRADQLRCIVSASGSSLNGLTIRSFARRFCRDEFNQWLRGKHGLQLMRMLIRALGIAHPPCRAALQKLSFAFGSEALKNAKQFLGDISSLRQYCTAQST